MPIFLQVPPDIVGQVFSVNGAIATLLLVALGVVWKEYKAEKKALADLNDKVRIDAVSNIQIIDKLSNVIDNSSENSEKILSIVTENLALMKAQERAKVVEE